MKREDKAYSFLISLGLPMGFMAGAAITSKISTELETRRLKKLERSKMERYLKSKFKSKNSQLIKEKNRQRSLK